MLDGLETRRGRFVSHISSLLEERLNRIVDLVPTLLMSNTSYYQSILEKSNLLCPNNPFSYIHWPCASVTWLVISIITHGWKNVVIKAENKQAKANSDISEASIILYSSSIHSIWIVKTESCIRSSAKTMSHLSRHERRISRPAIRPHARTNHCR